MPPTFLIFLGAIAYFGLVGLTLLVGLPMMLIDKYRFYGKLIILTALISFPTLLAVATTVTIIVGLPLAGFFYLTEQLDMIVPAIIAVFAYFLTIAYLALQHWYIGYVMLKNYLADKPLGTKLDNDRIYRLVLKRLVDRKEIKSTYNIH